MCPQRRVSLESSRCFAYYCDEFGYMNLRVKLQWSFTALCNKGGDF